MRRCRCCGAEVTHGGWLDVCEDPDCVRKGSREQAISKHLKIRPAGPGCYLVFVVQDKPYGTTLSAQAKGLFRAQTDSTVSTAVYFATEAEAKEFVARVRAGISNVELNALIEAHCLPPEHITIDELRRRAKADESGAPYDGPR
jgi:hypothetical protein